MALIKGKQILSIDALKVIESESKKFVSNTKIASWDAKAEATIATASTDGLISKDDKTKLDTIATGANNYIHPSTHAASMITEDSTHKFVTQAKIDSWDAKYTNSEIDNKISTAQTGTILKNPVATFADIATTYPTPLEGWMTSTDDTNLVYRYDSETTTWVPAPIVGYSKATSSLDGLMSKEDKVKVDSVETGANKYIHPSTHSAAIIDETVDRKFVTPTQVSSWDAKASTDVVTESANGLMSKEDKIKLNAGAGYIQSVLVPVASNGVTTINTGIMTNGTGENHTKSLKIALSINGMVQAEGVSKDFTTSESAGNELIITWTNRHFQLETDDEVSVLYTQSA